MTSRLPCWKSSAQAFPARRWWNHNSGPSWRKRWAACCSKIWRWTCALSPPEIIPLMQEETRLTTEYQKLYASARVPFQGKSLTIAQLGPYKETQTAPPAEPPWKRKAAFSTSTGRNSTASSASW